MSAALTTTRRTHGQLRSTLARIALSAAQIDAYFQYLGPDRPWGLADPTGWKCSEKFCAFYGQCPGGAGL